MKFKQVNLMLGMILAGTSMLSTPVLASNHSTSIEYTGSLEGQEEYEVTVPAKLGPEETGQVKLEGLWSPSTTINVTAPEEVTITEEELGLTKVLTVDFEDISQVGNADEQIEVTKDITIGAIDGALLGNWTGEIVYTITATDAEGDELHIHEWKSEYTIDQEADCDTDGSKSIHCKGCDEVKDTQVITGGHSFENGSCENCGSPANGLIDNEGNVVVTYQDLVQNYGLDVSKDYTQASIETDTSSLKYILVNYPELANVTEFIMDDTVTKIGDWALAKNTQLTRVVIGENVETIGENACLLLKGITHIDIPDSVKQVHGTVFMGCSSLKTAHIGKGFNGFEDYETNMFQFCENLESITVDSANTKYHSSNGQMIETATNTLLCAPNKSTTSTYTIPSNIKIIGRCAFRGNTTITKLTIPSTINDIGSYAFSEFTATRVYFNHTTAPTFGFRCFYGNTGATYYFKNSTVATAFDEYNTIYQKNYDGTISSNYSW